jgi:hypothetical protein
MDVKVTQQPTLTKEEWDLVIELIEREEKELHAEIHQTDSRDYRAKISQRLDRVDRLLKVLCPDKVFPAWSASAAGISSSRPSR